MRTFLNKNKANIFSVIMLLFFVSTTIFFSFDFSNYDLSMPIVYSGGDEFSAYKNAKMLSEGTNWIYSTERLGTPYGTEYYDFMPDSLLNVDNFIIKFFGLFTKDPVMNVNITVFFLFFLTALTAYYALKSMRVRNDFAVMGAVTFDFMYYHFTRLVSHFSLGAYEFVPLSILLCVWLWQDERLFSFGKDFFKYKKNYLVLLFSFLIANNGIAYYAFFTCMFLGLTGVSKAIKEKKPKCLLKMVGMIAPIVMFLLIALLPSLIYQFKNGSLLTSRQVGDSEMYAMKIIQLLIPYKDYGIDKLQTFHTEYNKAFVFTEAYMSYLGILASIGFVMLILSLMRKKKQEDYRQNIPILMMELNIFAVLFATMGGFSSVFANFVTGLIRGVNRMSIFIAFFAIAAVCIWMTNLMKHQKMQKKIIRYVTYGLFIGIVILGLYDQIPANMTGNSAAYMEEKESDSNFIQTIESQVPENAMIFQLPYHPYPEGGPVNRMADYHLLTGYLYSDTLRWSYGGSKGREGDQWNMQIASKDLPDMIAELKKKGFAGIYIDKRAYEDAIFNNMYNVINVNLGYEAIHSKNENLYFWKF